MSSRPPQHPKGDDWDDELDWPDWESTRKARPPSKQTPPSREPSTDLGDPFSSDLLYGIEDDAPPPSEAPRQEPRPAPPPEQRSPYRDPYFEPDPAYPPAPRTGYEPRPGSEPRSSRQGAPPPPGAPQWDSDPYGDQGYRSPDPAYQAQSGSAPYPDAAMPEPGRRSRRRSRPSPARQISVPRPAIDDSVVLGFVVVSVLSLLLMLATVAALIGDVQDVIPIHIDASGDPDRWGSNTTIWRIPFGVFMTLVMALVASVILWRRDRFAARFVLLGTGLAQILAWVAVVDFLW